VQVSKLNEFFLKGAINQVWQYMTVIPATQEADQGKRLRPYLKNKLKAKELGSWLKCKALSSIPVLPIKKKEAL
jgi:hypothetical protein